MTGLDYLFAVDRAFRDAVVVLAAAAIGTTNPAFAAEWLGMEVDGMKRTTDARREAEWTKNTSA